MTDEEAKALRASVEQDIKDKQRLRGEYTPKPGVCRVCKGKVVADVVTECGPFGPRVGGPPPTARVRSWHCEGCMIVYHRCPPEAP